MTALPKNPSRRVAGPAALQANPGSFRDPGGRVYEDGHRIYRTVNECAAADYEFVRSTGLTDRLVAEGRVLAADPVDRALLGADGAAARYVLEHPKLPFVSYPYEWCFSALKAAALLHLDVHLRALEAGVTLADASAYNVQFMGVRPLFIDHLSFRRYRNGEYWLGHRQFCEQFLNPLLLRAVLGVPHNAWYRGNQEGIGVDHLNRLIPMRRKLSWRMLTHVVLQSRFQRSKRNGKGNPAPKPVPKRPLPLPVFQGMLRGLRRWIEMLEPADKGKTVWADYAHAHSYNSDEVAAKAAFIKEFVASEQPVLVWDLGCNTGDYAKAALDAGASHAVGFDLDHGALDAGFARARAQALPFLPLYLDMTNPSPNQGWEQAERPGIKERASADAVLALAFVHHLAVGRNIPLDRVASWLLDLAPTGVVEFVPKDDPMIRRMLTLREDIFADYTEDRFVKALKSRAKIVKEQTVSASGRKLLWYRRRRSKAGGAE